MEDIDINELNKEIEEKKTKILKIDKEFSEMTKGFFKKRDLNKENNGGFKNYSEKKVVLFGK